MEEDEIFEAAATGPHTEYKLILKEFIICLESMPEVWDSSNVNHKNRTKRAHAYEKLLSILKRIKENATINDVRKKINSLRSNYRKELRKIMQSKRSGAGADEVYKPKSWVFHMLHFIGKVNQPVGAKSTTRAQDSQSTERQVQSTSKLKYSQPMENTEESTTSSSFSSISIAPTPSKKKKGPTTKQNELFEKACSCFSENQNKKAPSNHTDINPTVLYWNQKLKNIHPDQMIHAEKAINDILYEATQGTLHRYSVQINGMLSSSDIK